jgi:hypothetical protein
MYIPANRRRFHPNRAPGWNKIGAVPTPISAKKGDRPFIPGKLDSCPHTMAQDPKNPRLLADIRRAVVEVAFIIFLFYSNLLMGEFNRINGPGKTFAVALNDIFTIKNFAIAIIAASIGYVAFEYLRKKP